MFERLFTAMRLLGLLRRIARALERSNELVELRLSIEHPLLYKTRVLRKDPKKGPTVGEISSGNIEKWNRDWEKRHPPEPSSNIP